MITNRQIRNVEHALVELYCQMIQSAIIELLMEDPSGILESLTMEEVSDLLARKQLSVRVAVKFK